MPIGEINMRAFDHGIIRLLGAQAVSVTVDGDARSLYAVPMAGIRDRVPWLLAAENALQVPLPLIPIQFKAAEDRHQEAIMPGITVIRTSATPNYSRRAWYNMTNREAAPDADPVSVTINGQVLDGHTAYEERWQDAPYDIAYELQIKARRMTDLAILERWILRICTPPGFTFTVVDLLNTVREYDAIDISFNDTSELSSPQKREASLSVNFTVLGELTDSDPVTYPALIGPPTFDFSRKD